MSPEELDKARMMGRVDEIAQEAYRRRAEQTHPGHDIDAPTVIIAIELALSGWTPPPPVDPDRIAFEAWIKEAHPFLRDDGSLEEAYLAGARMAREQEQDRARVLVELLTDLKENGGFNFGYRASVALAAYKAGKEAAQ